MARKHKLAEMDMTELIDELRQTKHEALNVRFRNATGQLENTAEIPKVRRQIRRIAFPELPQVHLVGVSNLWMCTTTYRISASSTVRWACARQASTAAS